MKSFNKWGALIVAVIAIAVFVVAFFGISTKYGDIETIIVNSYENIQYGNDYDGGVEYLLTCAEEGYEPTVEEMLRAKSIVEKRLSNYVIPECEVRCDYEQHTVSVRVPYSARSAYSSTAFSGSLTQNASFAAYKGSEADESMLIFTADEIVSTGTDVELILNGLSYNYFVNLKLNKSGREALRQATEDLVAVKNETDAAQVISYWLDGENIGATGISEVITNGKLRVAGYNMTANDASSYALMIGGGTLPYAVSCNSVRSTPAAYGGDNAVETLGIALLAAVALCCVWLLVRYKLCGLASLIGMIGTLGGLLFIITGMFNSQNGVPVLTAVVFALAITLFLNFEANVRYCGALRAELAQGNTVAKSASNAFRRTIGPTLIIDAVVVVVCILLLLFSRGASVGLSVLSPIFNATSVKIANYFEFAYFGKIVLSGTLIGLLCSVLGTRYVVYSFEQFGFAKNAKLFGGEGK